MPLIALLDGTVRVDATDPDRDLWDSVWRAKPARDLTCRECGTRLVAVDRGGTRFFRHHREVDCASVDESAEHLRLKVVVAAAIRAAGWTALLEEQVAVRRADVLALGPDGRRIAMEVQLSPQHAQDTAARTSDYTAEGVDTIWVVQDAGRLGAGTDAATRLELDDQDHVVRPLKRLYARNDSVRDGTGRRAVSVPEWRPSEKVAGLDRILQALFAGHIRWSDTAVGWVSITEAERYGVLEAEAQSEKADAAAACQAAEDRERREAELELEAAGRSDQVGYGTAQRVAELMRDAGWPTPEIVKGGNVVAHAWVVRTRDFKVVIDPLPAHLDVRLRSGRWGKSFTPRSRISKYAIVASNERVDDLTDGYMRGYPVDVWNPPRPPLPSPDGREIDGRLLDAARDIDLKLRAVCGEELTAQWLAEQQAWVWALPDGATVALCAALHESEVVTPTGEHRVVLHANREVLRRDTDRRLIWRNLTIAHLRGEPPTDEAG